MASAGTRAAAAAALLFFFSAVVFLFLLLQAPPPGLTADLLVSALDRFLDGRGLLELLATRRNMILLCHAILLLILRDAGVLGAPASRRSRSPPGEAAAAFVVAQTAAPAPALPHATRSAVVALTACSAAPAQPYTARSTVVWRRRRLRNRAVVVAPVHEHDAAAGRVVVQCRPTVVAVAATWAAPVLTTGPPAMAEEEAAAVATKQIVVVESPKNDDDRRAAVVEPLEHPTAIATHGERDDCDDRRIIAVADDDTAREQHADDDTAREQQTAAMEMEMELADDRTFEEFIKSQRRQMRQESLHYQAATCY